MDETATLTGRVLDQKYQITSHLRPARMGDFWLARRLSDQGLVQIKMLDPALFNEPEALARFEREAKVVGALTHPCVMRLLDHGRTPDGVPYLVTEHVAGELLSEVIEEKEQIAPDRAARIAARVAQALGAAHDHGIVHRDLSPGNILVCEVAGDPDAVKVLEFGLARITDSETGGDEASVTAVGVRIGSPTYMAPEYIEEYSLDFRADLYGLGIVLYEMLVGQPPFTGRPYKVLNMHVHQPAPAPSAARPGVPPWLDALVLGLLEKQPGNRPKSASAVVEMLERGVGSALKPPAPKVMAAPAPTIPVAALPSRDPIIDNFIARQIKSVERRKPAHLPDRANCFVVDEVARWSLCGNHGVKPGWLCELPDESRPGLRTPEFWRDYAPVRRYLFTAPDGSEQVELTATGIEPGASFLRSIEMIRARFDPVEPDPLALFELWRQNAWEELERQCRKVMTSRGGLSSGLFSRLLGGASTDRRKAPGQHPGQLFLGAALVELGREKEGFELTTEFANTQAQHWPPRYQALAAYYTGLRARKAGQDTTALEKWNAGLEIEALPRMIEAVEKLLGERRNPTPWLAQQFPDYGIDLAGNQGEIRLSRSLEMLDGSQMVAVCMLGGFRGNLEYDEFVSRFIASSMYFEQFLAEVHVISTQRERESDKLEFYRSEDQARKAGIRLVVLHDALAWVQRKVKVTRIPTIFLVNRWGYVAHEGRMEPPALWEALRRTAMMRLRSLGQ